MAWRPRHGSASELPPLSNVNYVMVARKPDEPVGAFHPILLRPVSRNYFAVLGIAIVAGRVPDNDTDQHELVISEAAARELWRSDDPIGRTLLHATGRSSFERCTVVGVAKDVPVRSMNTVEAVIYRAPSWSIRSTLIVRNGSRDLSARVRAIAAAIDPRVRVSGRPFGDYVREAMSAAIIASRAVPRSASPIR
jgi:MacB-like periplasmic core domain